jgi:hypothetical protein
VTVSSATDELPVDCFGSEGSPSYALGSGQTERWGLAGGGTDYYSGSTKAGATPTVNMQRTWDSSFQVFTLIAFR